MEHEGASVTKLTYARVFSKAWEEKTADTMLVRNGFRAAGLYPSTKTCMTDKLLPATVFVRTHEAADGEPGRADDEGQAPAPAPAPVPAPPAPDPPAPPPARPFVTPSLKEHLRFPTITLPPKKRREAMPHAISTERYIAHLKSKRQEKEEEEKKKNERKEERKRKKTEKEEAKTEKAEGAKKKKKKTVPEEEEAMEELYTCGDCGGEFNDEDDDDWVECDACNRWFHVVCTDLANLTNGEIAKIELKCYNC